jgi:predicted ATPase/class 3 adenylate cyclase
VASCDVSVDDMEMGDLPTGTVSLLFSDIEGSTVLLSRLGAAYADALDGQRQVLRKAWAGHGGTELGTEGDSFFVVFATAEEAVAAATQAQHELAGYEWPAGEQVRVRMGIHTGTPTVHDGGYVGMDVHRAARIAGAAHGGQVLISEPTARLTAECLPDGVGVRDLGAHQLKDIAQAERLFQLTIEGLRSDFPPAKTLGTASSLPRPATPLVGRNGEVAELTALLGSLDVRLVTLTGPGGSGKTRLAIGVAQALVMRFPDGVYFVPLAAVTTSDVMWTSIAEVLDVPPAARVPPDLYEHVAHRASLLILDNLEQINTADDVVAQLLDAAPSMVVIATSRRPLHVPAEHEHPVPPLELPDEGTVAQAERSGAVQLFLQHAKKVRPSFQLTADNAADVAELCRRLDGLPLALELAAARTKLLSPAALLTRLDQALDLAATGRLGPSRQKTLRDTVAWSYDLLEEEQRVFFRRLGVFSGGSDLDAVAAVIRDGLRDVDPLDLVGDLVDASLLSITEGPAGEPRVAMLGTIRAYALDQLKEAGELDTVQERHAQHFLEVAEDMGELLNGVEHIAVRAQFEADHDNFRSALRFAFASATDGGGATDVRLGPRLCAALAGFWTASGYFAEMRRWLERAIEFRSDQHSPELARCLTELAFNVNGGGDHDKASEYASASVAMWRRLADSSGLPRALGIYGEVEVERGHPDAARELHEEALRLAQDAGDSSAILVATGELASLAFLEQDYERAVDLYRQAIAIARERGDPVQIVINQHNLACAFHKMGEFTEAANRMLAQVTEILRLRQPGMLIIFAEDLAATLAELGAHHDAVRLLGATDAMRDRVNMPRPPSQQAFIGEPVAVTRDALRSEEWNASYQAGRSMDLEDAVGQARIPEGSTQ